MPGDDTLEMASCRDQDIFRESLERLWSLLSSLIGNAATIAIFRSALFWATRDHPLLRGIEITRTGVRMDRLAGDSATTETREGLLALVYSIVSLVEDLTGDILLSKLRPLVRQLEGRLEDE